MKYLNAASYEIGHTVHLKRAASLSMATAVTAVAAMAETGNYFTHKHKHESRTIIIVNIFVCLHSVNRQRQIVS